MKSYMVYETNDGQRFESLELAEAWEKADKQWIAEFAFTYTKLFTIWAPSKEEARERAEKWADEIGEEILPTVSNGSEIGWNITNVYRARTN